MNYRERQDPKEVDLPREIYKPRSETNQLLRDPIIEGIIGIGVYYLDSLRELMPSIRNNHLKHPRKERESNWRH